MSPYGCPGYPDNGVHYISTAIYRWVGDQQVPGVVNIVVNDQFTPFYLTWLHDKPCTYEISLGGGKWVRQDNNKWVNAKDGKYQQWVLNKNPNGTYNIGLPGTNLVWTDMGDNKQIQLTTHNSNNTKQQFHIDV